MYVMLGSSVHLYGSAFRLLFIKKWETNIADYFPHSVPWFNILHNSSRKFQWSYWEFSSAFVCPISHLLDCLATGILELIVFFPPSLSHYSLYPEGEPVSMHLTAEATYYFCLSHLPHPLFSSELRSHLSLLWVPARKNWCTECDLLSV